jgi:E3 ubiquitin-protein ligase ATL41
METNNMPGPPEPPGLDPEVIAALPMYRYTHQGKGDVPALDCAICLCELDEGEEVKLLPVCMHLFHKDCIKLWLEKNKTCPMCRTRVMRSIGEDVEIQ